MAARRTLRIATVGGLTAFLLLGAVARGAWAGPPTEQLKRSIKKAITVLQDPVLRAAPHSNELRATLRTRIPVPFTGKLMIAPWHPRS